MSDLDRLRVEYARRRVQAPYDTRYTPFNPAYLFEQQHRQRGELRMLRKHGLYPLSGRRVLDFGCGSGGVLLEYLGYTREAGQLHGFDLLPERVADARELHPGFPLACADGQSTPYPAAVFDLVVQHTVFSSVLDPSIRAALACEMLRVLKTDGLILWYDFWLNPTNPQTRGIRPQEIRLLFPGCRIEFQRITLAPPLARRLVPLSWKLAALVESLGIFCSHYLCAIKKK